MSNPSEPSAGTAPEWQDEILAENDVLAVLGFAEKFAADERANDDIHRINKTIAKICRSHEALRRTLAERDAQIKELTMCDCGEELSHGRCPICDNDE